MGRKIKTEFTEKSIQKTLWLAFMSNSAKKYEIHNMFVYDWESDYLAITKSDYAYECEIKVSRADFFRDTKKRNKHLILEGKSDITQCPNYFYYVVPKDMVKLEEVPEFAGLIYVINSACIDIVKEAPKINPNKQNIDDLHLIDKFYYRMLSRELEIEQNNVSELKQQISALEKDNVWYDNELSLKNSEIDELKMKLEKLSKES